MTARGGATVSAEVFGHVPAPAMAPGSVRAAGTGELPALGPEASLRTERGVPVTRYTLRNAHGLTVRILDYGGIITEILAPDRDGRLANICLGYDSLPPYLDRSPYFGALIGRYANRIAHGRFTTEEGTWQLACNNGAHHLHGGVRGFDKQMWHATATADGGEARLGLRRTSPDGEEGYPGRLDVEATYTLTAGNALHLSFSARTDRTTPVSLTNHAYFNLTGAHGSTVLGHELTLHANHYLPVDAGLIPTGALQPVDGTAFDFRTPRAIGAHIATPGDAQLDAAGGYDHHFVLRNTGALRIAAHVREPHSGRTLELLTDAPGLQFYSGNFLDGADGFPHRGAFCLEPGQFPDAPNQPRFPSALLHPGAAWRTHIVYRFGTGI